MGLRMPTIELADILHVIALSAFAGGTSLLGGLIGRSRWSDRIDVKFGDQQVLFFTAFGAGAVRYSAMTLRRDGELLSETECIF